MIRATKGDTGATGASFVSGCSRWQTTHSVSFLESFRITWTCGGGRKAMVGGVSVDGDTFCGRVANNGQLSSENQWETTLYNGCLGAITGRYTVYCCSDTATSSLAVDEGPTVEVEVFTKESTE